MEKRPDSNFKRQQVAAEVKKPGGRRKLSRFVPKPIRRLWHRYGGIRILLLTILVLMISITSYLFYLSKAANVGILKQSLAAQTVIMDGNNQVAGAIYGQKGTQISFNQIPQSAKDALIATEDRTFYKNDGVNFERTLFALVTLGHFGGGSTITQQLAKNAYLTQAQTVDRKAREIFLALQIDKHYSKDDILTMYFNQNNYGSGAWGLQDASHKYFGVDASQLTVDEAATLVGLLKGPAIYNPYASIQYATERRNTVLQNMVAAGFLKQADANRYSQVDMKSELADNLQSTAETYKYPSYYNAVIAEAQRVYHLSTDQIANGGYKIYTALNQNMQDGMQQTYAATWLFPKAPDGTSAQSASVAIDPKTGGVLALVGSVGPSTMSQFTDFNYATQSGRSPGSAIKPMIVYSPAVQAGWPIDKVLEDKPTDYNGWKPQDADGQWRGQLPMYQALAWSYNIPAIDTYQAIGPGKGNAMGRAFGLNLTSKNDVLSTALGAGVETNPWQIAQAYSTFANNGTMNTAHLITKIENAAGQTIATAQVASKQVISQDTADKMTSMMLGTYSNGTGYNAGPVSYTMAGKTGTNEDIDQWVVGYTPDIVIALWEGFANPSNPAYRLNGTSEGMASSIFRQEASYIMPYTQGSKFTVQNAYAEKGIGPLYPAWTTLRQQQDNIVSQEQASIGSKGNTVSSATASTPPSSSGSGFDIGKTAKDIWNKIKGIFK